MGDPDLKFFTLGQINYFDSTIKASKRGGNASVKLQFVLLISFCDQKNISSPRVGFPCEIGHFVKNFQERENWSCLNGYNFPMGQLRHEIYCHGDKE